VISFDSEKDFENFLIENDSYFSGLFKLHNANIYQQLNLGPYGVADIVAVEEMPHEDPGRKTISVKIFELKNTPLKHEHISQISRYREFFMNSDRHLYHKLAIKGYLIGKKTFPADDDFCFLCQSIPWLDVCEFSLDPISGIEIRVVSGWKVSGAVDEDYKKVLRHIVHAPEFLANEGAA